MDLRGDSRLPSQSYEVDDGEHHTVAVVDPLNPLLTLLSLAIRLFSSLPNPVGKKSFLRSSKPRSRWSCGTYYLRRYSGFVWLRGIDLEG